VNPNGISLIHDASGDGISLSPEQTADVTRPYDNRALTEREMDLRQSGKDEAWAEIGRMSPSELYPRARMKENLEELVKALVRSGR
jgi:hypothetical protein